MASAPATTVPPPKTAGVARVPLLAASALNSVLALSLLTVAALMAWVLFGLGGWAYYLTPIGTRGYQPVHAALRPSGPFGQSFGIAGMLLMLTPFIYSARKRLIKGSATNLRTLLEIHVFCGIVGPALITFHTAFKFNGIVSAAYWSMVAVMLSGFVGRYLYVRIPRTIRGVELDRDELDGRLADLKEALVWSTPPAAMVVLGDVEQALGAPGVNARERRRLTGLLTNALERAHVDAKQRDAILNLLTERAQLVSRIRSLKDVKRWFDLWHVFHLPLVFLMLIIVVLHVGLVLYMGYVPFRW